MEKVRIITLPKGPKDLVQMALLGWYSKIKDIIIPTLIHVIHLILIARNEGFVHFYFIFEDVKNKTIFPVIHFLLSQEKSNSLINYGIFMFCVSKKFIKNPNFIQENISSFTNILSLKLNLLRNLLEY